MKKKVLIVEDEPDIAKLISNRLDRELYEVSIAHEGLAALSLIQSVHFDLISLDIMLPRVDGLFLCQKVREKYKDTIIIMVSALSQEDQISKAYEIGADDFIAKPFSPKVLALKISTLLIRRFEMQNASLPSIKTVFHDEDGKRFYINNKQVFLTSSEYTVFSILFEVPKKVFTRDELAQIIYDRNIGEISSRGIDTHIYQLRRKIKAFSEDEIIRTVRGVGYCIEN